MEQPVNGDPRNLFIRCAVVLRGLSPCNGFADMDLAQNAVIERFIQIREGEDIRFGIDATVFMVRAPHDRRAHE
jgi:hypothetical protein